MKEAVFKGSFSMLAQKKSLLLKSIVASICQYQNLIKIWWLSYNKSAFKKGIFSPTTPRSAFRFVT